jgi:hypothetical protein
MDLKDIKVVIKKLSHHLPGGTEVNHEIPHEGLPLGRAIAQAVSRWLPSVAAQGLSPGLVMWDLW